MKSILFGSSDVISWSPMAIPFSATDQDLLYCTGQYQASMRHSAQYKVTMKFLWISGIWNNLFWPYNVIQNVWWGNISRFVIGTSCCTKLLCFCLSLSQIPNRQISVYVEPGSCCGWNCLFILCWLGSLFVLQFCQSLRVFWLASSYGNCRPVLEIQYP